MATFIFTHCADICPMMTQKMATMQKTIPTADVKLVSFTVDAKRDTLTARRANIPLSFENKLKRTIKVRVHLDVSLAESRDGGANWASARRLNSGSMPLRWLPDTGLGRMVGDYISTSYAGGRPIAVVSLAFAPRGPESYRQAIHALSYAPPAPRKPKPTRPVVR